MIVQPGVVSTAMTKHAEGKAVCNPDECAYGVVRDLGYRNMTFGAFKHVKACNFSLYLPTRLL